MTDQDIIRAADDAELCFPVCWSLGMDQKDWGEQEHRQMDKLRRFAAAVLRDAVAEVAPDKTVEDIDFVHQYYLEGYKDALYEILILVNELEAQ